jgi:hypothetical protein
MDGGMRDEGWGVERGVDDADAAVAEGSNSGVSCAAAVAGLTRREVDCGQGGW